MNVLTTVARIAFASLPPMAQMAAAAALPLLSAQPAQAQMNCLAINHMIGYTQLRNYCTELISVWWNDQNYCASGCMAPISGNSVQSATTWVGHTTYCVCWGYDKCCAD